jgi:hypothetical protein
MDVWFCESRNHRREAHLPGRGILNTQCARSPERDGGQLCFPLTKTYMDVGKPSLTRIREELPVHNHQGARNDRMQGLAECPRQGKIARSRGRPPP